jgi:hypothetical protein
MKRAFSWLTQAGIVGLALVALAMGTIAWVFERIRRNMQAAEQPTELLTDTFRMASSGLATVALESAAPDAKEAPTVSEGLQNGAPTTRIASAPGIADGD